MTTDVTRYAVYRWSLIPDEVVEKWGEVEVVLATDHDAIVDQYRNGYQGSCTACIPVAERNNELREEVDRLEARIADLEATVEQLTYDDWYTPEENNDD